MEQRHGKIGVFDSGLGGLVILRELRKKLPQYDYVFFGDQQNLPFGEKNLEELYIIAQHAIRYLYEEKSCIAVLIACNTISANLYDRLKEWVTTTYPKHYIFGIGKGTVDSVTQDSHFTVFGTPRTIASHRYKALLEKRFPKVNVSEIALPALALLVEKGEPVEEYLKTFVEIVPHEQGTAILACTHYGIVINDFQKVFPQFDSLVAQENVLPVFFESYFQSRDVIRTALSTQGTLEIISSCPSESMTRAIEKWFPGFSLLLQKKVY